MVEPMRMRPSQVPCPAILPPVRTGGSAGVSCLNALPVVSPSILGAAPSTAHPRKNLHGFRHRPPPDRGCTLSLPRLPFHAVGKAYAGRHTRTPQQTSSPPGGSRWRPLSRIGTGSSPDGSLTDEPVASARPLQGDARQPDYVCPPQVHPPWESQVSSGDS